MICIPLLLFSIFCHNIGSARKPAKNCFLNPNAPECGLMDQFSKEQPRQVKPPQFFAPEIANVNIRFLGLMNETGVGPPDHSRESPKDPVLITVTDFCTTNDNRYYHDCAGSLRHFRFLLTDRTPEMDRAEIFCQDFDERCDVDAFKRRYAKSGHLVPSLLTSVTGERPENHWNSLIKTAPKSRPLPGSRFENFEDTNDRAVLDHHRSSHRNSHLTLAAHCSLYNDDYKKVCVSEKPEIDKSLDFCFRYRVHCGEEGTASRVSSDVARFFQDYFAKSQTQFGRSDFNFKDRNKPYDDSYLPTSNTFSFNLPFLRSQYLNNLN